MQFKIPFKGSQAEGIQRIKRLLDESRAKIAGHATIEKEEWQGNVLSFAFTAQGKSISGTATVGDNEIDLYAKLPLSLRLFEGTIEKMIAAEVAKLPL